jgi:hypothetical protein
MLPLVSDTPTLNPLLVARTAYVPRYTSKSLMRSPSGRSIITVGVSRVGKPNELEFVTSKTILKTDEDVPLGSYPDM